MYNGFRELVLGVHPEGEQLFSKFFSNFSGAETSSSFSTYKYVSMLEMEDDWLVSSIL